MSKKLENRLVGKTEYLEIQFVKGASVAIGTANMIGGILLVIGALTALFFIGDYGMWSLFGGVSLGVLGGVRIRVGIEILKDTGKMKPVALLTKHNTGDLPEVETLVRASDLPPLHQQAELLRAAQPKQETPPEELLRATNEQQGR